MNYIIFGGTGFIGTHLANLIAERHPDAGIWSLDIVDPARLDKMTDEDEIRQYTTIKQWKSPVVEGQVRKAVHVPCDVRRPIEDLPFVPTDDDVVFCLAAVHRTPGHPDEAYFETNIRGAEHVSAFCERWDVRQVVYVSTIALYGADEALKMEETLPMPNTPYGISKLVAEETFRAWQKRREGRRLTIVRPGVVFGKGENGNFTRLYWGIRRHTFAYPGRKDTIKACIYVKELVRFLLWNVEERTSDYEVYNCTYEPAYTIEQIVRVMKRITGLTQFVPYVPSWVIMPLATMAQLMGSPMGICPARVRKLQVSTNISGKKMAEADYRFRWTFDEAMADWYEDNHRTTLK